MKQLEKYPLVKKEFEKWYFDYSVNTWIDLKSFYSLSFSMQWGVWIDFFDSKRININIRNYFSEYLIDIFVLNFEGEKLDNVHEKRASRTEARQEALNKAFEIRNKQLEG